MSREEKSKYPRTPERSSLATPFDRFRSNVALLKNFKTGHCYLANATDEFEPLTLMTRLLEMGLETLVVSRESPTTLQKRGLQDAKLVWLSNIVAEQSISGQDLETLSREMARFVKASSNGVVYLDGFEYLATHNDFNVLMKFINTLKDTVSMNQCFLLCIIAPEAFETRQLKLLQREFEPMPTIS